MTVWTDPMRLARCDVTRTVVRGRGSRLGRRRATRGRRWLRAVRFGGVLAGVLLFETASPRAQGLPSTDAAVQPSASSAASSSAPSSGPLGPSSPASIGFANRRAVSPRTLEWRIRATGVVLGEGWGCARTRAGRYDVARHEVVSDPTFARDLGWQCWRPPGATRAGADGGGASIRAWRVPWMAGWDAFAAGPDRLCSFGRGDLTFRCWSPPARGETAARELAGSAKRLDATATAYGTPLERITVPLAGGTFACVHAPREIWCAGDDSFGQLGAGAGAPSGAPVGVRNVSYLTATAVGTWHGCMLESGFTTDRTFGWFTSCWGRGDAGQLGASPGERCVAAGRAVACARSAVRGPTNGSWGPASRVRAGDLFTCVVEPSDRQGPLCWGASRDGWFGSRESCPAQLRRAWPTLHGEVPAPRASCSSAPVHLARWQDLDPSGARGEAVAFGPRGACLATDRVRCAGAIRAPEHGEGFTDVTISPGADAAACALRDGAVFCWGEGYSQAATSRPVRITFELPPQVEARQTITEEVFVGGGAPESFDAGCLARTGCTLVPPPLVACPSDTKAEPVAALLSRASALEGSRVTVHGPLGVGPQMTTAMGCGSGIPGTRGCCNRTSAPVWMGGGARPLELQALFCQGDDSAACCNAPAYGLDVVASGFLRRSSSRVTEPNPEWRLDEVSLCRAADGAPPPPSK